MPRAGYFSLSAGVSSSTQYITGYNNRYWPHQHNGGLSPLAAEEKYKKYHKGHPKWIKRPIAKAAS